MGGGTFDEYVFDVESPRVYLLLHVVLQLVSQLGPMLQQLLENVLADHTAQGRVRNFLDEFSDLGGVVSEFVDQFVGVDRAIIHHCFDLHAHVVLCDHLLRRHPEN